MTVLTVSDIHKRYRKNRVLEGASLFVEPGEIVGLTGENGSGKSTLMKILVGMLGADAGSVQVNGNVGYCPQETALFDALTMTENIDYFAAGYGIGLREARDRSAEMFDRLGCREHIGKRVSELSGGTKQKLNLIVSLLHNPAVLILDEPYQGFDYESYLQFWDIADELKGVGQSVLIVSHMLADRDRLDRTYVMQAGKAELEQR